MAREIEAKYRLDDPDAVRARLVASGAKRITRVLEDNRIFDTAERKLLAADCGLRLRTCQSLEGDQPAAATLTYKGPRATAAAKVREELETPVARPDAIALILQRLGLREVVVYQKRRETWQLNACLVCLDELPRLGWFVEVEGPDLAALQAALEQLGLSSQSPLRETYVEIAATYAKPGKEQCARLLFVP